MAGLAVHRAGTTTPNVQKERKRALYIRAKTFMAHGVDDHAGKAFRLQRKIAPAQAVVKSLGNLAFKPVEFREFVKDHTGKLRKSPGSGVAQK